MSNLCLWLYSLGFKHFCLSQCYLLCVFELKSPVRGIDSNHHVVDNGTFFSRSDVRKGGWPPFKGFETERERVLSRLNARTLINDRLIFCKHISCLEVRHFEIPIAWGFDEFGSKIFTSIAFWLNAWNVHVLNYWRITSVWVSWEGGIAAIGSWGCWCYGKLGFRLGLWSSLASSHFTHS